MPERIWEFRIPAKEKINFDAEYLSEVYTDFANLLKSEPALIRDIHWEELKAQVEAGKFEVPFKCHSQVRSINKLWNMKLSYIKSFSNERKCCTPSPSWQSTLLSNKCKYVNRFIWAK